MNTLVVIIGLASGGLLILGGMWLERRRPAPPPGAIIRPLSARPAHPPQPPAPVPATATARPSAPPIGPSPTRAGRFLALVRQHPAPLYGWLETILWLVVLLTAIDHLRDLRHSPTAQAVWYLTIGPHEIGHIICIPFGWTLQFLGGSLWQILWWLLLAVYVFLIRRQLSLALLFWAITGHSFLNLSPYIADARARELPLLFGLDSSHHDWWNLLERYDLLDYDHTLAAISTGIGAVILASAVIVGVVTAWALPRTHPGPIQRFEGYRVWSTVKAAFAGSDAARPGLDSDRFPSA